MNDSGVTTADPAPETFEGATKHSSCHLIIRVIEDGKPKTNIRLPLSLARMGMKFIPVKEKENLKQQGIDIDAILCELTGEEVGPLVQLDEEGKSVWIGVE